jgi:glycosyltransferase involved in cell wall biosynthesis
MKHDLLPSSIFIVEPRLWAMVGHEFEHVLEFAKGIKHFYPERKVIVLSGKQDEDLRSELKQVSFIDLAFECFPRRMISDSSFVFYILKSSFQDALSLRSILKKYSDYKNANLLFSSLALYQFLLLAFLRLLMPFWKIKATGIFRYDPISTRGTLRKKYYFILKTFPAKLLWKLGVKDTTIGVDSHILQDILCHEFKIKSSLAPIPVPGIWKIEKDNPTLLNFKIEKLPLTVGYIGQPRSSRGFDLFVNVAIAMERERLENLIRFKIVIPPDGDHFWNTKNSTDILRYDHIGISFEEHLMDSEDFAYQMSQVDIIWALGDPNIYKRQTSGIVTHAICLGKKLITNKGGWAEELLINSQDVRFVEPNLGEVVIALDSFLSNCTEQKNDDNSIPDAWRKTNSQSSFYQWIFENLDLG